MTVTLPQLVAVGDVVLVVIVPDGGPHRLLRQDGTVDLLGGQTVQRLHHRLVAEGQGLADGLALDELRGHGTGGDGAAAAEGVELHVGDGLGVAVHLDIHPHDVAALGVAHCSDAVGLIHLAYVPGMLEVVHDLVTV